MTEALKKKIRCAIYTRKSSDEGLEQEFNSLDAQYEACNAYIVSQKHEGWRLVTTRYDDGGISGGTIQRPALNTLLADIDAGLIDMIVVYKIDRLTRSLSDFSKIVDRLDNGDTSFVSVTQSFNTATSMGRLTLNMLLSFAQFEREVTAERIRDKIAASKAKGLWMGGTVPLGYDPHPDKNIRGLVVNNDEAKNVKMIFNLYHTYGNLNRLRQECEARNIRSKLRLQYHSRLRGGSIFSNGQLHHLLTNPIYIGKIKHKDKIYDGQHDAIIGMELWEHVQNKLQAASTRKRGQSKDPQQAHYAWLKGKLFDETGNHLTSTHTKKNSRITRYYISNRLLKGKDPSGWRLPAKVIEENTAKLTREFIGKLAQQLITDNVPQLLALQKNTAELQSQPDEMLIEFIDRIHLHPSQIELQFNIKKMTKTLQIDNTNFTDDDFKYTAPLTIKKRGVEQKLIIGEQLPQIDETLIKSIRQAHRWLEQIKSGKTSIAIAQAENKSDSFIRKRLPLALLSPNIQKAIIKGEQPIELTSKKLIATNIPAIWAEQEKIFNITPK